MRTLSTIVLVVLVIVFGRLDARADTAAYTVSIAHVDAAPKIDGTIDDPEWRTATHVQLGWDYQYRRPANEQTDAYIMIDPSAVDVAFVAQQKEPLTASIHTNDVVLGSDDFVRVLLWPGGVQGFEYLFVANPIGTHNEASSENSNFAPTWRSAATRTATGYIVTMRFPLNVMRGDGRSAWRVQFQRNVHLTNQFFLWSHDPAQTDASDPIYAGTITGLTVPHASSRIKPRLGVYALGQIGSAVAGGDTTHAGADLALPITDTSSFFGTFHPDYSNVDLDQQTISPTAFARQFREVRPFFTQGSNIYQNFDCNDCVDYPYLYTPGIPTPRDGYAVEGQQGLAQFSAFDSIGHFGRSDDAESFLWQTPDKHYQAHVMNLGTNCPNFDLDSGACDSAFAGIPGFHDDATFYQVVGGNRHNSSFYFTDALQRGSFVSDPAQAYQREYGFNLYTQKFSFDPAYHEVGSQFAPFDGFFQVNDLKGPTYYAQRLWDYAPTSSIQNIQVSQDIEHFRNSAGQFALGDSFTNLFVNTRTQFQMSLSTGYQYLLIGGYGSTLNQNGIGLNYGVGTTAPSSVTYNVGRFGPGYLRSTTRLATLRTGPRATLTFEGDNTNQTLDTGGIKQVQWLERVSFAYSVSPQSSVAIGDRRIIGTSPSVVPGASSSCSTRFVSPGCFSNASNLSFAYHRYVGQDEVYVVYGDPNQLNTLPAFIVKFVHYFGAQKGT